MPTIPVNKVRLDTQLGKKYSEHEFDELCFEYGLELDEITTEKLQTEKEKVVHSSNETVKEEDLLYKIEVPANRYDLLCYEGISQALRIFLHKSKLPDYTKIQPKNGQIERLIVKSEVAQVRPYVVAAILRDLTLDQQAYASLIDLQEKLHFNLCRKRTLVAVGVHDLDTIQGPFLYTALPPADIKFKPLNQTKEYTAVELMKLYSTDTHLRLYLHIIESSPVYPVIFDKNHVVLSMPPIINGDHSKLSPKTKNIFIEVTATDLTRAKIVLDTLVTTFSQYCSRKHLVEPVEVVQADGAVVVYPELKYWTLDLSVSEISSKVGADLSCDQIISLLERMCLKGSKIENNAGDGTERKDAILRITVPPIRHDIMHACDVVEDIAVAYGYNNIQKVIPPMSTVGGRFPLNRLTDLLRYDIAAAGFTEILTFSLCSQDDICSKLRRASDPLAIHIANPKTLEFQVARTTLLPGMLKTIGFNKDMPLPLKLFEIQDVVLKDDNDDVGAKNQRHFCAVNYNKHSGFEVIHGLLDRFMELLSIQFGKGPENYYIKATEDPIYFPGRCATVYGPNHTEIGKLGVLHPEVISAFELTMPCSALEINIEPFL